MRAQKTDTLKRGSLGCSVMGMPGEGTRVNIMVHYLERVLLRNTEYTEPYQLKNQLEKIFVDLVSQEIPQERGMTN